MSDGINKRQRDPLRHTATPSSEVKSRLRSDVRTTAGSSPRPSVHDDEAIGARSLDLKERTPRGRKRRPDVSNVMPQTKFRESLRDWRKRRRQRAFAEVEALRMHRRRVLLVVIIVLIVAAIALVAAAFAYQTTVSNKMQLDQNAKSELTAPASSDGAQYVLITADTASAQDTSGANTNLIILARIDPANREATLLSIPGTLEAELSDGVRHPLNQAISIGGNADMIEGVKSFTGLNIAHYVHFSTSNVQSLVDTLGGLSINVSQEVDDPDTGCVYVPGGQQMLSGEQVLSYISGNNYENGDRTRAECQRTFVLALFNRLQSSSGFGRLSTIDAFASNMQSDYTAADLNSLADAYGSDASDDAVYQAIVPGSFASGVADSKFSASSSWSEMESRIDAGEEPTEPVEVASNFDASKYTVDVRNGSGDTGTAAQAADKLKNVGFNVTNTSNAGSYVYDETLVVYRNKGDKAIAESIVKTLGKGRAIEKNIYYKFDTDFYVVIGKDWTL